MAAGTGSTAEISSAIRPDASEPTRKDLAGSAPKARRILKAFVHEGARNLAAVVFGHAFTARNGVPPCALEYPPEQ